jgi:hypothetical protein
MDRRPHGQPSRKEAKAAPDPAECGVGRRLGTLWLPRLNQAYGHAAALKYARDQGYEVVTDEAERDGTRRPTLRRIT